MVINVHVLEGSKKVSKLEYLTHYLSGEVIICLKKLNCKVLNVSVIQKIRTINFWQFFKRYSLIDSNENHLNPQSLSS